jgi:putative Mg2+ transporter-C (MgtC) family protein
MESALTQDTVRVLFSVLIGLLIGAEREYWNKSAGLRTFILVSFGACIFTIVSEKMGLQNPERIASNIVTGIGFLGAGVIWHASNRISGITTATSIWATASLGLCVGVGEISLAFLGTFIVLFTLRTLSYVEEWFDALHKIREYEFRFHKTFTPAHVRAWLNEFQLKGVLINEIGEGNLTRYTFRVTGKSASHAAFTTALRSNSKCIDYRF